MLGNSNFGFSGGGSGGGGGSLTGANNGLHVMGTIVQLGGALILPTNITATPTNFLDIQDSFGSFVKTRDANQNFSIADFGGNSYVGTDTNIFSYLAVNNTYTDSNIIVNFGSFGVYTNAGDTWNFGDNSTFNTTSQSFNFGRSNTFVNTISASVVGNSNSLGGGNSLGVFGNSNTVNSNNTYVLGRNNIYNGNDGYLVGRNHNIDASIGDIFALGWGLTIVGGNFVDAVTAIGFVNTINATSTTRGVYIMGDSHVCNDFVTFCTLIGESCSYTRADHCSSFGIFNTLVDTSTVYLFGEGNSISNSSSIISSGNGNNISDCISIVLLGNSNAPSSISNATIIGIGNINALSDEILIAQNDLGIRVDQFGNVGIGVPYTETTIKARTHIKGVDAITLSNQRLEPVNGVYQDTTGATIPTTNAAVTPLETIDIPADTIVMIESFITCRKTAGVGVGAIGAGNGYVRTVKAQNIGGVVTIGVVQSSFTSESITAFNATFAVSGTNVVINVTGALSDDVTWNSITKKYRVA